MSQSLWTARVVATPGEITAVMARWEALEPPALAISAVEKTDSEWWVEAIYDHEPDTRPIEAQLAREVTVTGLQRENWVARSLEGLAPVRVGRFVVFGAHDADAIPINLIRLQIEASLAFGTGHHATTRGCLIAIDQFLNHANKPKRSNQTVIPAARRAQNAIAFWPRALRAGTQGQHPERQGRPPWVPDSNARYAAAKCGRSSRKLRDDSKGNAQAVRRARPRKTAFLDIGTGTGVLALAIAKGMRARVIATDIDPVAVQVARANARANGARQLITAVAANGLGHHAVAQSAPCDLIVANILANPLARLAPQIVAKAGRGASIMLSGVLTTQARFVLGAYLTRGCVLTEKIILGEWTTLVLRKR